MLLILILLLAYIVGSIPFAAIVAKILGTPNPAQHGSKNPGATNMMRIAGKKAGIFTFLGDSLKGFLFLELLSIILPKYNYSLNEVQVFCSLCAIFLVLGHIYSIFLKFKGGKGVATTLGVLFVLNPIIGLLVVCSWVIVFAVFRISGLSAIVSCILLPIYTYYIYGNNVIFGTTLVLSTLILFKHKSNLLHLVKRYI
jgi:glycerol-3-phosphate acyltransferase PlsY